MLEPAGEPKRGIILTRFVYLHGLTLHFLLNTELQNFLNLFFTGKRTLYGQKNMLPLSIRFLDKILAQGMQPLCHSKQENVKKPIFSGTSHMDNHQTSSYHIRQFD